MAPLVAELVPEPHQLQLADGSKELLAGDRGGQGWEIEMGTAGCDRSRRTDHHIHVLFVEERALTGDFHHTWLVKLAAAAGQHAGSQLDDNSFVHRALTLFFGWAGQSLSAFWGEFNLSLMRSASKICFWGRSGIGGCGQQLLGRRQPLSEVQRPRRVLQLDIELRQPSGSAEQIHLSLRGRGHHLLRRRCALGERL